MQGLLESFIPLFVAIDAVGVLPVFWSMTDEMERTAKNRLITHATLAAFVVSIIFLLAGKALFRFLGITEADFRIAGGLILLIISIADIAFSGSRVRRSKDAVGVVPIGVPLIMGPAALTTILISVEAHGAWVTSVSLVLNLVFVWLIFRYSHFILKILGDSGSRALGKVMSLFLAAIAVMMIRVGIQQLTGY